MSAPVSMLPGAANDARPARPVAYQSLSGAQAAAQRAARQESTDGTCAPVADVSCFGVYLATGAAAAYEVTLDTRGGDYLVKPLSMAELARRLQASLRARIDGYLTRAERWDADAEKSRMGAVRAEFRRYAAECRAKARELEMQLTMSAVA